MKSFLLKITPRVLKDSFKDIISSFEYKQFRKEFKDTIFKLRTQYDNLIFIIATPVHGNLGDQAIVYAELEVLNKMGLRHKTVEISCEHYLGNRAFLKRNILKKDTIVIDGGGNLGTLWPGEDRKITEIIKRYRKNKIIIFPQTCYYNSTNEAKQILRYNNRVYSSAKNLTIALRDQQSFDFCCQNFAKNINLLLVPDVVLYLNDILINQDKERDGILLCLRRDLEGIISSSEQERLKQAISARGIKFIETSTVIDDQVFCNTRESDLMKKWSEFCSSKLLITDRLHGMIFAIVTNTPCLAVDNLSKKVSGVYNVIDKIGSVKVCKDIDGVIANIDCFYNLDIDDIIVERTDNKYKELIDKIKE